MNPCRSRQGGLTGGHWPWTRSSSGPLQVGAYTTSCSILLHFLLHIFSWFRHFATTTIEKCTQDGGGGTHSSSSSLVGFVELWLFAAPAWISLQVCFFSSLFYWPYDSIRRGFFDGLYFYFLSSWSPPVHSFSLCPVRSVFSGVVAMGGGAKEEESHVSSVGANTCRIWVAGWSKGCLFVQGYM